MMRLASAILLGLALAGLTLFAFAQQTGALIRGEPSWELLAARDARATPAVVAKARRLLAQQPLDQAKLNLLFATEAKGDIASARRALFRKTLYALGWRDTATQQNLIVEAGLTNDPNAAILHIDALLRRGKLTDNILPVLLQIEAVPQATELLAARIEKRPSWRERYLRLVAAPPTPASVTARARLLTRILDDGDTLSHAELKPSLDAMIRAGFPTDALDIAMRANPGKRDGGLVYDPDFARFAAASPPDRDNPLPFEWEIRSRPGVSVQIAPRGQEGQLRIRWNGTGVPVIARTMTFVEAGQRPRLDVAVDGVDAMQALDKFRFSLSCREQRAVAFRVSRRDAASAVAHYLADDPVSCDYPDLMIRGHPQGRDRAAETIINSIRLLAS